MVLRLVRLVYVRFATYIVSDKINHSWDLVEFPNTEKKNLIFKVEIPETFDIKGLKKGYENN